MARRQKHRVMNQINVVPYIDVTLVLLIIFMVTAPMTNPGVVELPKVGQALKQPTLPPMVITVKKNKMIEFQNKALEKDGLLVAISAELEKTPDRAIVIAADKNVVYDDVIQVMNLLKVSAINKVGLLLSPQ